MAEYMLTFEATIVLEDPVPEGEIPTEVLVANFRAQQPTLILLKVEEVTREVG